MPALNAQLNGRELKPSQRAIIHGMAIAGTKSAAIARMFKVHRSTISRTLQAHGPANNFKDKLRSGRPRKTTSRQDDRVYKKIRNGYFARRHPLAEVQQNLVPNVSVRTLQRRIQEKQNIRKCPTTERPFLNDSHKQQRLE